MNTQHTLLTREQFHEQVFKRDMGTCVFCALPAEDAHHILDRKLWSNGGYYLNNGASVCARHHMECEQTLITVEQVRAACGITNIIVPPHFNLDQSYDKWGNTVLPNGQRTKGELFNEPGVQKILREAGVLSLFTPYVKYPRTPHLYWSASVSPDDCILEDTSPFIGQRVIVTEKLDGENTSLYRDYYHARSVDSRNHPSRNLTRALHAQFAHDIPEEWRVCCENVYAKHSIAYENLESYLYGISVWDNNNRCLSWDDCIVWFKLLGIPHVPVMYDGIWDEKLIRTLYDDERDWKVKEGYVVRIAYKDFHKYVAKYVRKKHIQTTKHWMWDQEIVANKLKQ